jgi:hypothetical protein
MAERERFGHVGFRPLPATSDARTLAESTLTLLHAFFDDHRALELAPRAREPLEPDAGLKS